MNSLSKLGKLFSLFLILPTVLLALYVAFVANSEIEIKDVVTVSISDGRYVHRYSGKEHLEKYVALVLNAKNNAVQETEDGALCYTIDFELKNGSVKSYQFYPSLDGDSLLKDGKGFIRTAVDVDELLLRVEYDDLFEKRHLPTVMLQSTGGKVSLMPCEYAWSFRKTGEDFYPYNKIEALDELPRFSVSAEVLKNNAVSFSVSPDELKIAYIVGGSSYGKLESLSLKEGDEVEISVSARWNKKDNSLFYGEGKWRFNVIYKASPLISIDKNQAVIGECIVLNVENVDEGEKLLIETDIDTYKNPSVYAGENKSFALLPVGVGTDGGEHELKVTCGDSTFNFKINVTSVSNGFFIKNVNAEIYNKVTSPDGIKEYESFVDSLVSKTENGFLWNDKTFSKPVEGDATALFASEILYNGLPPQVYFEGESFEVPQKTSVKSAEGGKVVFAGETAKTGKAVVIDHGCGIMTHYYHLSVISAMEGEITEGEKLIGLSGQSGFTDKENLHFAVSVNGVFVNPALFY